MITASNITDGVYFGIDEDIYHAIPALSSTGIKNLLISPMDFWARSWMNPHKDDEIDGQARIVGKAYHKRILEGREAFYAAYGATFEPPSVCLKTIEDMQIELLEAGIVCASKWKKADYIAAIRQHIPGAILFDDAKEEYDRAMGSRIPLSGNLIDKIEIAAAMIERHPDLSKCFTGGYPEVSVIWTEDDIRMKARLDYLKPKAIVDLKTFANMMNKPIDSAIYSAMASNKYHIQASFYLRAVEKAKEMVLRCDADVQNNQQIGFWEALRTCEEHGFYFIFQQKGVAPLARGFKFPRGSIYQCGVVAIEQAIEKYRIYRKKYGTDPWVDDNGIESFHDDQFPNWTVEL